MDNFVDSHCGGRLEGGASSFLCNWSKFFAFTEAKGGSVLLPRSILQPSVFRFNEAKCFDPNTWVSVISHKLENRQIIKIAFMLY
jgi:hypothetical protein